MFVYRYSLVQLNYYHKALHENERFLSSVNLLEKFSSVETRDDMLQEIIKSEMQMNFFDLCNDEIIKANYRDEKKKRITS